METRKGARSIKDIPSDILQQLNEGKIESANLTEWLAIDHRILVESILPENYKKQCLAALNDLKSESSMQQIKIVGQTLFAETSQQNDDELYGILKAHISDSVRCWAAYIIGSNMKITFADKLQAIKIFASDSHFGVREISWMAVRQDIENNLDKALQELELWAKDKDENIRRFSTESIRPIGVWCNQSKTLKEEPYRAIAILNSLKSDSSKYVQDSVGNWLNDASKSQPEFVSDLCNKWLNESNVTSTQYIVKKALRTINK